MTKLYVNIITISVVVLSVFMSGLFLNLGWSYSKTENETVSLTGEWIPTERTSIHESNFSCPNTGELVGDIWDHDGAWRAHSWAGFDREFKDEDHAKFAVEKFVRESDVCKKGKP